jgi:hypothetical protein
MSKALPSNNSRLDGSDDSDDEDFVPDAAASGKKSMKRSRAESDSEDDHDSEAEEAAVQALEYDSGDEKTLAQAGEEASRSRKRRHDIGTIAIDAQDEATAVRTRSQRQEGKEADLETRNKAAPVSKTDVDSLWAALNAPTTATPAIDKAVAPTNDDDAYIMIKRDYIFAGEKQHEEKRVSKDSAEGRAYLATQGSTENTDSISKPKVGAPRKKRMSKLDQQAAAQKTAKLNTLEKSRLEWASFVDREGIADDLKLGNRDGYNVKQDFLRESEGRRNDAFKAGQQQAKK